MSSFLTSVLSAAVGAAGFAILFRANARHLPADMLGGALATALELGLELCGLPLFTANLLAALAVMLYAEGCARVLHSPVNSFLVPALIPLVPGSHLYYAMLALIRADFSQATAEGSLAMLVGFGLAGGIVVSTVLTRILFRSKS